MKKLLRAVIPLFILVIGIVTLVVLIKTRPKAKRELPQRPVPMVEVLEVRATSHQVIVKAMGTVVPAREVVLQPQVGGLIVEQHPRLVPGGCFSTGDVLARIDPRDYELAIIQQQANVERAQFELQVEEGRQRIAQREWNILEKNSNQKQTDQELGLRKPHLRAAKASLEAARSRMEQAELNRERTIITAPFNCFVKEEYIDVGQLVSPQTRIANLVGTDQFWVQVSLPVEHLSWIAIPRDEQTEGSPATVVHATGSGKPISRPGRVTKMLGELDPVGRMARLLIEVDDPLSLGEGRSLEELPLMVGAYIRVEIEGKTLRDIFAVPRISLHDLDRIWIMNADDQLGIRTVEIAWRNEDTIFITKGLQDGDRVITSSLPTPVVGMDLKCMQE